VTASCDGLMVSDVMNQSVDPQVTFLELCIFVYVKVIVPKSLLLTLYICFETFDVSNNHQNRAPVWPM
jgi:hypothetical protein